MDNDDREQLESCLLDDSCMNEDESVYLTPCAYCGMPADSVDHIPPRHMRVQLSELELRSLVVKEVPAYRECNSVLGCRPLLTMEERRDYVRDWMKRKYGKYLRIPDWSEDKLQELSHSLQGMVRRGIAIRDTIRARLRWLR